MELVPNTTSELNDFIDFLFGGLSGIAYVATKNPNDPLDWHQHYFQYPEEISRMESVIQSNSPDREVYLAPALYSKADYRRESFLVSNVVWTEFDGNAPTEADYNNPPSYRVQSSKQGHEHVYWKLNNPISNVDRLEEVNRTITYALSADSSAWDATQILRPPGTYNHKRNSSVGMVDSSNITYDVSIFDSLPQAPTPLNAEAWQPSTLPDVAQVILKYPFPEAAAKLFSTPRLEHGKRSNGLMELGYLCCEMGMSNPEIFCVLLNADERWKKFAGRKDQYKRLAHIITIARNKHPLEDDEEQFTFAFDFVQFLNTDIEIDWVVEGMLMENGSMLMVGPSGIGKTQISLNFAIHLALGKDYWHYKIPKPRKMIVLSLEMGHGELKIFATEIAKQLKPEDFDLLQENLIIVPHGEKWPLNTPIGQEQLIKLIDDIKPDGILIDSVGSAIAGSINKDEDVQNLVDFNDRIRKKYSLFLWYIHHLRKSTNGGSAPSAQDDIYGNQYLLNRATSSYGILRGRDGLIKIRNFKNRLSKTEDDYYVRREEHLSFVPINQVVDDKLDSLANNPHKNDSEPTKFNL